MCDGILKQGKIAICSLEILHVSHVRVELNVKSPEYCK